MILWKLIELLNKLFCFNKTINQNKKISVLDKISVLTSFTQNLINQSSSNTILAQY